MTAAQFEDLHVDEAAEVLAWRFDTLCRCGFDLDAAAVIAAPDPIRDEEVMACVVPNDSRDLDTARSIQDWCLERLAYFKAPGYVAFLDELPVTSTNKVQKAKLADFAINPASSFDLRERKKRR